MCLNRTRIEILPIPITNHRSITLTQRPSRPIPEYLPYAILSVYPSSLPVPTRRVRRRRRRGRLLRGDDTEIGDLLPRLVDLEPYLIGVLEGRVGAERGAEDLQLGGVRRSGLTADEAGEGAVGREDGGFCQCYLRRFDRRRHWVFLYMNDEYILLYRTKCIINYTKYTSTYDI